MKRTLGILLALALVLTSLFVPALAEEQEILELDMWAYQTNAKYTGNVQENVIQDAVAEITGVKITEVISTESMDQNEKFNLLYAADMMPAIIYGINWNAPFLASMDEADFCYRYSDEMLAEYLPDLCARMPEITFAIWKRASGVEYEETMWIPMGQFGSNAYTREQYPGFNSSATNGTNIWSMRDDVLQALFPDALSYDELMAKIEAGEELTYDDLYIEGLSTYQGVIDALYAAHEQFPDVITVDNIDTNAWIRAFLTGTWYAQFDPITMEVYSIAREKKDEFNAIMADLNKMYRDGLVEEDFAILKSELLTEYRNAGTYAMVTTSGYDSINEALALAGKDMRYRPVLVSYDTGDYVFDGYGMLETGRAPIAWAINKNKVSEEDLPKVLNYINYFFTEEGMAMLAWGPESTGLWSFDEEGNRQWNDPEFAAVVNGEKPVGQMKDYDYYGINAIGAIGAQQAIFPTLTFHGYNPYSSKSAAAVNLTTAVNAALNNYNKGYWDNAYSAWNTTSATNNDFWQYWADMGDACKKAIVAVDDATFESELAGFYAIFDKFDFEGYLADQGNYTNYAVNYTDGASFHPGFLETHPELAK